MANYWNIPRPKRKLNSVPEELLTFSINSLDKEWKGEVSAHLTYEELLEEAGLKRKGERRDQRGGGGRTYKARLMSLGLIFTQTNTGRIKLTLAGEAIINGDNPVEVLKHQVLKFQFPSSYSIIKKVDVSSRFKVHPFVFLLRLLNDYRVEYLTQEEIAKIVIVEAENDSARCFEHVVSRILQYRNYGDSCLEPDFLEKYKSTGEGNSEDKYGHLNDVANTCINWLEYTQLARRNNKKLRILPDKKEEVSSILANPPAFIDRPTDQEYFQRKYGTDPKHKKDTRNLIASSSITARVIAEQQIKKAYIIQSLTQPITTITKTLIDKISETTGFDEKLVEEVLLQYYPNGSIGSFMTEYFEMAFKGRDEATEFEKATVNIFQDVFGFEARHVGPIGLTPDVLILSDKDGYSAIIDNKAYSKYSISNDHHNRMVHNYIGGLKNYYSGNLPLSFFTYIAGGFGSNIENQIQSITNETNIHGSAMSVSNMIELIKKQENQKYSHAKIRDIFSVGRQIVLSDLV